MAERAAVAHLPAVLPDPDATRQGPEGVPVLLREIDGDCRTKLDTTSTLSSVERGMPWVA